MTFKSEETKQQIIDEVCSILSLGKVLVGAGSTEPAEFFRDVAAKLDVETVGALTKPDLGRRIVEHFGLEWDDACDSRSSHSGGGSTVTSVGLQRIREAARASLVSRPLRETRTLDIRPGIESLLSFRHHGYDVWYAVAELVDNAVSSFRTSTRDGLIADNDPLRVEVVFDKEKRTIIVSDNAGGIQLERLEDALIAGRSPFDKSELNQFGMGLKTASFWFGSHLNIETFPVNSGLRIDVDVDLYKMVESGAQVIPKISPVAGAKHGTRIAISGLWPEREIPINRTLGKVRDYLSSIYRRDISSGRLVLEVGGQTLEPPRHEVLVAPRWDQPDGVPLRWEKVVEIDFNGKKVDGIVWLLSRGDTANAGLVLTWKGKAIVGAGAGANDANDSYRPPIIFGRSNSFLSQRLMGEFDMSMFPVTAKKDGLEWTHDEQEVFARKLRAAVDEEPLPMIKMASMYRKRVKSTDVSKDINTAATSLITALQNLDVSNAPQIDFDGPQFESEDNDLTTAAAPAPSRQNFDAEDAISHSFDLPVLFPGMRSGVLRIEWDPGDHRVVYWNREGDDLLVIHVNRGSNYLENYSALPQFHLEPVLRILVALVMAEIQATAEGLKSARRMTAIVNERLGQSLGQPVLPGNEPDE